MKTFKNLVLAVGLALSAPNVSAQSYSGGIISTGAVSVTSPSTNGIINASAPPIPFSGQGAATAASWFEIQKDRGLAIQVAVGGTITNCTVVFEGSADPSNRTNWTNSRFLTFNLPTGGGVLLSNVPSSALGNVRGVRLSQILGTNGAGTFVVTNVILGTWR